VSHHAHYDLSCDAPGCEARTGLGPTVPKVRELAQEAGWQVYGNTGYRHFTQDLCPLHNPANTSAHSTERGV
jgi:hypothetical protein